MNLAANNVIPESKRGEMPILDLIFCRNEPRNRMAIFIGDSNHILELKLSGSGPLISTNRGSSHNVTDMNIVNAGSSSIALHQLRVSLRVIDVTQGFPIKLSVDLNRKASYLNLISQQLRVAACTIFEGVFLMHHEHSGLGVTCHLEVYDPSE